MKTHLTPRLRAALIAAILTASSFKLSSAHATGVAESKEELRLTTLNEFHRLNANDYPNRSAYQLEEVSDENERNLFYITKYLYKDGIYTPVQYNVVFNNSLGDKRPDDKGYETFTWVEIVDLGGVANLALRDEEFRSAEIRAYSTDNKRFVPDSASPVNVNHSFVGIEHLVESAPIADAKGGAIYGVYNTDSAQKHTITGDFVGNLAFGNAKQELTSDSIANSEVSTYSYGGGIYIESRIQSSQSDYVDKIVGNFIGNTSRAQARAKITDDEVTLNFAFSYAKSYAYGGAIYNSTVISDIVGDFVGNSAYAYSYSSAKARYKADSYNYAVSDSYAYGGAIANHNSFNTNQATINNIIGDFIGNYAYAYATSPLQDQSGYFGSISASPSSYGGAIYSSKRINTITGDFIGNYAYSSAPDGGTRWIEEANAYVYAFGGAIYNHSQIKNLNGDFIGNFAYGSLYSTRATSGRAEGGAIYNWGNIANITGSFIGNYASVDTITEPSGALISLGGAIYNHEGSIGFLALDSSMQFSGNYTTTNGGESKNYEAIYSFGKSTFNFNAYADNSIIVNDAINSEYSRKSIHTININNGYDGINQKIDAKGKAFSTVSFNSYVYGHNITVHAGVLQLGKFAGMGKEGEAGYVRGTQASLNYSNITINAGALVQVQGQLTLDSRSYIDTRAVGAEDSVSTLRGLAADSSITGGRITVKANSSLSIEDLILSKINIQSEENSKLTLKSVTIGDDSTLNVEHLTLRYDNVAANHTKSLTSEATLRNYTLSGIDVGKATVTGSLTLDIHMTENELEDFELAYSNGEGIFFSVTGLDEAELPAEFEFASINGQSYSLFAINSRNEGMQFIIVPEPSTATLSLFALTALLVRRRRKEA